MVFTFLNSWKRKEKKNNILWYVKIIWNLNISDHKVSLEQSHTLHVYIVCGCFCTIMVGLSSFDKGLQSLKYLLSGLYRESLLNPDLVTHLASTRRAAWKSLWSRSVPFSPCRHLFSLEVLPAWLVASVDINTGQGSSYLPVLLSYLGCLVMVVCYQLPGNNEIEIEGAITAS